MIEPLTDEQCSEAVKILGECGNNKAEAARRLEIFPSTLHNRLRQAALRGLMPLSPVMPGFEISKVSETQDAEGNVKTRSVQQTREAGEPYKIRPGFVVKKASTFINADGRVKGEWLKTEAESDDPQTTADAIRAVFEEYRGHAVAPPNPVHVEADLLTVYNIADHHLGMYSYARETGADYDLAIGEKVLLDSMSRLVGGAPPASTAIVLNLGDFFHTDNALNRTERSGHVLDVDTRYAKVLQTGVKLMITCIELALAKHGKVIVRCLPGNHDPQSALALSVALAAFFDRDPRVVIDCDPGKFFFHLFGKVMVAATHGDMVKPERMGGVVAASQPIMWGASVWRYAFQGHIHHRTLRASECDGIMVETFQTLAPKDSWSAASGFSSGRSMVAITMHREHGEFFRHTVSIPPAFAGGTT